MTNHSYYVVMVDYGRRGQEAIVDPEVTRAGVISRLASGEYGTHINFIHHIADGLVEDVTNELFDEAESLCRPATERGWDRFVSDFHGGVDPLTIRAAE